LKTSSLAKIAAIMHCKPIRNKNPAMVVAGTSSEG